MCSGHCAFQINYTDSFGDTVILKSLSPKPSNAGGHSRGPDGRPSGRLGLAPLGRSQGQPSPKL